MTPTNEREADLIRSARSRTLESVSDWLSGSERRLEAEFRNYKSIAKVFLAICLLTLLVATGTLYSLMQQQYRRVADAEKRLQGALEKLAVAESHMASVDERTGKKTSDALAQYARDTKATLVEMDGRTLDFKASIERQDEAINDLRNGKGQAYEALRGTLQKTLVDSEDWKALVTQSKELESRLNDSIRLSESRQKELTNLKAKLLLAETNLQQLEEKLSSSLREGPKAEFPNTLREWWAGLRPAPMPGNEGPAPAAKGGGDPSPN